MSYCSSASESHNDRTTTKGSPHLLETLALSAGQPLTRGQLLDHVWGPDHTGESNIVDVCIGYLRKKLGVVSERSLIQTVRGVGYRLVAS